MRVIIAGGRDFTNRNVAGQVITACLRNVLATNSVSIVSGMAQGADRLGWEYGKEFDVPVTEFPADWKTHGKSAGYKRNVEMAQNADALIAFWDGASRGTKHMIDIAHQHKLKVRVFSYTGQRLRQFESLPDIDVDSGMTNLEVKK